MQMRGAPVFETWSAQRRPSWAGRSFDVPRIKMTRLLLSTHFRVEEFDCHDGTRVPASAHAALKTWCRVWGEPIREAFGPVRVTSGYRTTTYNRSVGGAPASFHVYTLGSLRGVAADVVPARGTPALWAAWAKRHYEVGTTWPLGASRGAAVPYPRSGFIHLDTGPRRTWAG